MRLSRHLVSAIIVLIVISLVGLLLVQAFLIDTAQELKEQAFRRNVQAALNSAAQKLEFGEAATRIFLSTTLPTGTQPHGKRLAVTAVRGLEWTQDIQVLEGQSPDSAPCAAFLGHPLAELSTPPIQVYRDSIAFSVPREQHVQLTVYDASTGRDTTLVDDTRLPGIYSVEFSDSATQGNNIFRYQTDSLTFVVQVDSTGETSRPRVFSAGAKEDLVKRVVNKLVLAELEPIEQRLDTHRLDSVLGTTFKESGIHLDYAFAIATGDDSLRMVQPAVYRSELQTSSLRTRLFPNDLFAAAHELVVYFPQERTYLWRQMTPLLVMTFVFMVIITLCFIYTIRTILRQRRFAGQTVEFINNMTHEFKTPISTIALATEALMRSDTADERMHRYGRMIQDENTRMRSQVDKILQMAVIEEGDYDLHLTDVDVHDILTRAANSLALHVEAREGTIGCTLEARQHIIKADPVHLTNVFHNLLDNANKYSPEKPVITVTTRNGDGGIFIRIQDNGIGIREKDLKFVFDKYYRVSSGNIHNVKGFGIGLSYVKLMVAAHGGRIRLDSQIGKGTQVELFFPVVEAMTEP